ncbi:FAD-binding oxidoreductase [Novosphingobium piscinae]|uniref:FAD-binding oxidoreductase n=1 Tax=Novosphingobium piscinae TaxID=1507448 RepID=A0A7X1KR25_9SPHN|nr:FAD-binding oxidoreductase [Novosphingobium piscinae]MBC2670346.1 FAD-binding oxidoreductase [Novosphingobium piscinae]
MTSSQDTFLAAAADLLGPRGLTTDPDLLSPWLTDWRGRFTGRTLALASPGSTAEVAALVRLCAEHGVPIVPQGGNSGMCGGATPDESGTALLLSLRRLDAIAPINTDARQVTCGAGTILETLHHAAEAVGLRFPLTLGGKGSATVGGLISTNAGGTQVLRHGSMRALVLGLEAVLADGSVFSALTPLKKDNRGFDLKQVLIGSEGTLGIVTAATLRLVPAVAERVVIWAGLTSLQRARALLLACEDRLGGGVEGFEVMPASSVAAVLAYDPGTRAPLTGDYAWHVLIEVVADATGAADLRDRVETAIGDLFEAGLLDDAVISSGEAQAEALWRIRESIPLAERAQGPAVQHDISVPVERMPDFVDAAVTEVETRFPGVRAVAFGHLGDGNVHFHALAPKGSDGPAWYAQTGKEISSLIHDRVVEWAGSISAEHGIGQLKRDELERLGDPVSLALMRQIKRALDPHGLLNPGKLVTLAPVGPTA